VAGAARQELAELGPVHIVASFYPAIGLAFGGGETTLCYDWPLALESHIRLGGEDGEVGIFGGVGVSHTRLGMESNIFFEEPIKNTGLYINAGIRSNTIITRPLELRISYAPNFSKPGHSVLGMGFVYWVFEGDDGNE
jgi:hypothetical protein